MVAPTFSTAAALLALLEREGLSPSVRDQALILPPLLPQEFVSPLRVLQSGIRAILTDKSWYGCSCATGWSTVLSPELPIPGWVGLLCVAGDEKWHRIPLVNPDVRKRYFSNVLEPKPSQRLIAGRGERVITRDRAAHASVSSRNTSQTASPAAV